MTKHKNSQSTDDLNRIGDRVRIFTRGSTWYANFQANGKQRRISLKTTSRKQARRQAIRLETQLDEGTYNQRKKPPRKKAPSINTVTDRYLDYLRTERKAAKTIQKDSLVVRRLTDLARRRNAKSTLDIDLSFVDAYRSERVAAGAGSGTISNETVIIRQIINFALSRKLLRRDPLAGLKLKKPKPAEQPCWSRAEVDQILTACKGPLRNALVVLAETGMRLGEAKWLTWQDIDFDRNIVHVRAKPGWRPKTGDQRAIPISPMLQQLLQNLPRKTQWVLTSAPSRKYPAGDHQISQQGLWKYLKRRLKELGLSGHLHTFRHSFISHALTERTAEATVRSWVGHVDAEIMKTYTHINDTASQAAMQRLAARSGKITETGGVPGGGPDQTGSKSSTISAH
jgi:integrase